jgi:hypothetical protein
MEPVIGIVIVEPVIFTPEMLVIEDNEPVTAKVVVEPVSLIFGLFVTVVIVEPVTLKLMVLPVIFTPEMLVIFDKEPLIGNVIVEPVTLIPEILVIEEREPETATVFVILCEPVIAKVVRLPVILILGLFVTLVMVLPETLKEIVDPVMFTPDISVIEDKEPVIGNVIVEPVIFILPDMLVVTKVIEPVIACV